jgi:hypothetical protein
MHVKEVSTSCFMFERSLSVSEINAPQWEICKQTTKAAVCVNPALLFNATEVAGLLG